MPFLLNFFLILNGSWDDDTSLLSGVHFYFSTGKISKYN